MTLENKECFVIMPISDSEGYEIGHFRRVYDDIITPACNKAGYKAVRADDVVETNMIHMDVLKRLLESPMAICDLSSSNPNVLFELGIRQAFDKPVVLIQEIGTPRIFDIIPIRCLDYRKDFEYRQVKADQLAISNTILATQNAVEREGNINSIVQLLSLSPAKMKDLGQEGANPLLQVVMMEIEALRRDLNNKIQSLNDNKIDAFLLKYQTELKCSDTGKYAKMMKKAESLISSKLSAEVMEGVALCKMLDASIKSYAETTTPFSSNIKINQFYQRIMKLLNEGEAKLILETL